MLVPCRLSAMGDAEELPNVVCLEGEVEARSRGYDWWMMRGQLDADDDERKFSAYCGNINVVEMVGRGILCRRENDPTGHRQFFYCKHCHWEQTYADMLDERGKTLTGQDLREARLSHHRACPAVYDDCITVTVLMVKQILKTDRLNIKMIDKMSEIPNDALEELRVLAHTPAGQIALRGWKRQLQSKAIEKCSV